MSIHNYFVKFLIKINKFINSLLSRNLNKLNAANLKNILINNKVFLTIVLLVILFFSYLSLPNVFNKNQISAELKKNLLDKLNLEFNLEKKLDYKFSYTIGTMIELPSAALNSASISEHADFFSFGTNDLTQTTLGLSRDDASKFLNEYVDRDIFSIDPFVSIDVDTVGKLVEISVRDGKGKNKEIKIGVCGEHAGESDSIHFLNTLGIDYISCSPFRIPTARLAAAQAEISK